MTKYNTLNLKLSNSQFNKPGGVVCDRTIFWQYFIESG